jgi:multidrug efflux system membrane fusion protein
MSTQKAHMSFRQFQRKHILIAAVALVTFVVLWQFARAGADEPKTEGRRAQVVPVVTAGAAIRSVPIEIRAIGQVEAASSVDVHAQVGGQLTRVAFQEGDFVRKGQVLFTVDARTSQTDVAGARANYERAIASQRQAEANLSRDRAIAQTAAVEARRYEQLVESGVVSRSQYDQARTAAEAAAATVRANEGAVATERKSVAAAKAALDAAQVQLGFTTITAPVAGRTGALQAHAGDVVAPGGQTPLVVINQIAPIYVTFSVPEAEFVRIKQAGPGSALAVRAAPAADPSALAQGSLSFVDNTVDPATGTIKLKATFPNGDERLWPGQFVNVSVTLGVDESAVVVPKDAIQTGQQGQYVFVVGPDDKVELRTVEVARVAGDVAVIANGLDGTERVVTDGQMKLTPGAQVREAEGAGTPGGGGGAPS